MYTIDDQSNVVRSTPPDRGDAHKIIIVGESGVGKTCFLDQFVHGKHFAYYNLLENVGTFHLDGLDWNLEFMDLEASHIRAPPPDLNLGFYSNLMKRASGVVLLYDITSEPSFRHVTHDVFMNICHHRSSGSGGMDRFGCVLVGNKVDLAGEKREVEREEAEWFAEMVGVEWFELDAWDSEAIRRAMTALVRMIKKTEEMNAEEFAAEEGVDAKSKSKGGRFSIAERVRKLNFRSHGQESDVD